MKTFNFPPAPSGHYFQIKRGMMASLKDSQRWRVVLVRRVWGIFPVEVSGAQFHDLQQDCVYRAAEQAREGYFVRRALKSADKVRKATNRVARRMDRM